MKDYLLSQGRVTSCPENNKITRRRDVLRRYLGALLLAVPCFIATSSAHAITIAGEEFEEVLSVYTAHDLGFWANSDKYFTFRGNDNYIKPDVIHRVNTNETGVSNRTFREVFTMGASVDDDGPLAMGVVELYGAHDELLLSANYTDNGSLSTIRRSGRNGQLDIVGAYQATGGSLFDQGIFTERLYIEIEFDRVWQNKYKDLKTHLGTYTFYNSLGGITPPPPPPTDVPEPMSMGLLFSGLIGAAGLRQRKKE